MVLECDVKPTKAVCGRDPDPMDQLVTDSQHPASPELFAAVAALWHLSQVNFDAVTGATTPPPVWPMALQAAVADPLGDADTADNDSIDAAVLVPLALPLLTCSMRRLQRKAAAVTRKALCAADVTAAVRLTAHREFLGTALSLMTYPPSDPDTLIDVLWCLVHLAAATTPGFSIAEDDAGVLPACVAMLSAGRGAVVDVMLEPVLEMLAYVADADSPSRDRLLALGVIDPVIVLLDDATRDVTEVTLPAGRLMRKCFAGKPHPSANELRTALPAVVRAVGHAHIEVAVEAAWAISYYTDFSNYERDHFVAMNGAVTRIFAAMHRCDELLTPCLRIAGNLCSGTSAQTCAATEQGLMQAMPFLLTHAKRDVAKEAAWTLSNILTDSPKYITLMLHLSVFPHVLQLVRTAPFEVRREAVWCVANAVCGAADLDVLGMLAAGVIAALASVVDDSSGNQRVLTIALEAVEGMLHKATDDTKAAIAATPGMLASIGALLQHEHPNVVESARKLLLHLEVSDDDDDDDGDEAGYKPSPAAC